MSCSDYLYNLVDIIAKYAVKEHYTDNGADCEQLEEIKRMAKDLNDEVVYSHAEEVQKYIMNKSKRRKKMSEEKNLYHAWVEIDMPMKENETMEEAKQRMIDIFRKTDIDYLFAHNESIRKCYTMKW